MLQTQKPPSASTQPLIKPQKACVLCRRSKVKCVHNGEPPCKRCIDNKTECKFRLRADDENWRERTDETLNRLEGSVDYLMQHHQKWEMAAATGASKQEGTPILPYPGPQHHKLEPTYSSPRSPHVIGKQSPYFEGPPGPQYPSRNPSTPSSSMSLISPRFHNGQSTPNFTQSSGDSFAGPPPNRPSSTTYLGFDGGAGGLLSQSDPQLRTPSRARSGSTQGPLPQLTGADINQIKPSTLIVMLQDPIYHQQDPHRPPPGRQVSIAETSPYANPSRCIGRDDPRLTVISMGLVTMDTARQLFMFFARNMQPQSYGFPSYPATEQMTPLIIASILMVSSMHEPFNRHLHDRFRHETFAAIDIEQQVSRENTLDPELGIGVEEITGACIAACWLGGATAYKIARIARWWAVAYLKHFEVRSAQTLGEWMTILPPFRQIDLVEKLRIWLMSYVTEAQQAVMLDRASLIPDSNPAPYCEGLLNSPRSQTPDLKNGSGQSTPGSGPLGLSKAPPSDRQLVAHARLMSILLASQDWQRETRRRSSSGGTATKSAPPLSMHSGEWLDELERWRRATLQHDDLSTCTETSVDLSLVYHLARAYLASPSLHLEPSEAGVVKQSAVAALRLLSSAHYADRLSYLPNFYHFLLGHAAALLLLLVQRREAFLVATEADDLLSVVEPFIHRYVFQITNRGTGTPTRGLKRDHATMSSSETETPASSIADTHPSLAQAESLARALTHTKTYHVHRAM